VVDVPDRADVDVGLVPLELLLAHGPLLVLSASPPTERDVTSGRAFVAGAGIEPATQRL
jgi:hypothetical protein